MTAFLKKTPDETCAGVSVGILAMFGLFFAITVLLSEFPAASLAALVAFVLFGLYVCLTVPSFLLKYFIVLFGIVAAIAGCFSCEFLGGYLPELRATASFVGSLPLLILNYYIFLTCLYGFDKVIGRDDKSLLFEVRVSDGQKWFKWIHFGFTLMIAVMFLHVLPNPSFVSGGDRFSYTTFYLTGVWRYLHSVSMILCIVPLLAIRYGYKKSGCLAIVLFCFYLFWTGVKFSGFYMLLGLASLVFYDKVVALNKRLVSRALAAVFLALGLLLGVAVFAHSFAASSDTSSEFFFNRTAQQSQLWWSTYEHFAGGQGLGDFSDELSGLSFGDKEINECVGDQYGIYKMMYLNAPTDLVNAKLASGSRYTEAAYPSIYYYFGAIGTLAFSVLTAFVTVFLINLMIGVMHRREFLPSLACFVIWKAWSTFRSMLLLSSLFDLSVLLSVLIIFVFSRDAYNVSHAAGGECKINRKILNGISNG